MKTFLKEQFDVFDKMLDKFNSIKTKEMKRGIFNNFIDDFEVNEDCTEEEDCFEILRNYRTEQNLDFLEENIPNYIPEMPVIMEEINYEFPHQFS